jgi:hypothetical protein
MVREEHLWPTATFDLGPREISFDGYAERSISISLHVEQGLSNIRHGET